MTSKRSFYPSRYSADSPVFNHENVEKGQQDQLNIFKNNSQEIQNIDVRSVEAAIDILAKNQHRYVDEARSDKIIDKHFILLQQAAAYLYETKHYDELIVNKLKKKEITDLTPGKIGQFLFGNIIKDLGQSRPYCSPITIGALPINKNHLIECDRQVWCWCANSKVYQCLTSPTYPSSKFADIYVSDSFKSFTDDEIVMFKKHDIKFVTLLKLGPGSDYSEALHISKGLKVMGILVSNHDRDTAIDAYNENKRKDSESDYSDSEDDSSDSEDSDSDYEVNTYSNKKARNIRAQKRRKDWCINWEIIVYFVLFLLVVIVIGILIYGLGRSHGYVNGSTDMFAKMNKINKK